MISPVMKFGDTVVRNATTSAMSSGVPILRSGIASMIFALIKKLFGQSGTDRTRADRVDRDMRREFLAEGPRQAKHAGLGGAVCKAADCVRTGAHVSANGGYVDDAAALLRQHRRCDRLAP